MKSIRKILVPLAFVIYFMCSCGENIIEAKVSVYESNKRESIIIDLPFTLDSITIVYYSDSIKIQKYKADNITEIPLNKSNLGMIEYRRMYKDFFEDMYLGIDSLLFLSNKDTTYSHYFPVQNISLVSNYSYTDCSYTIGSFGKDGRITTKQSLIDTTYREIFYYDKDFNITKIINTWKDNICIYNE